MNIKGKYARSYLCLMWICIFKLHNRICIFKLYNRLILERSSIIWLHVSQKILVLVIFSSLWHSIWHPQLWGRVCFASQFVEISVHKSWLTPRQEHGRGQTVNGVGVGGRQWHQERRKGEQGKRRETDPSRTRPQWPISSQGASPLSSTLSYKVISD